KPPANQKKPAFNWNWGQTLAGDQLKALVAEMKKQNVPGLGLGNLHVDAVAIDALAKGVPGLQTLVCEGATIDDKGLTKLSGFGKLRLLRLESPASPALLQPGAKAVTGAGLKALKDVKSLQRLELAGQLDDKAMEALAEVKSLRSLSLSGTEV